MRPETRSVVGVRGKATTTILLNEHGNQMTLNDIYFNHRDPCITQPSSEKLLLAVDGY